MIKKYVKKASAFATAVVILMFLLFIEYAEAGAPYWNKVVWGQKSGMGSNLFQ